MNTLIIVDHDCLGRWGIGASSTVPRTAPQCLSGIAHGSRTTARQPQTQIYTVHCFMTIAPVLNELMGPACFPCPVIPSPTTDRTFYT